jgi:glycosyltransferase involved in cell wall biosynthesis
MQKTPLISCVTTVYNTQRYVAETIESILAQTLGDFEYILVDDGSKDDSLQVLRKYEQQDKRIRVITGPNRGIVGAANEGLKHARGEFLARIDSDDVAMSERFEKQAAFLQAHPEVVAVGCRLMLIDPYGSPIVTTDHKLTHEEIEHELLINGSGWALSQPAVMMRRALVVELGGYRKEYEASEDLDLALRLAERGKLANLPDVLLKWRRHLNSCNYTRHEKQWNNKNAIVRETYKRRGLELPKELKLDHWIPPPPDEQLRDWGWRALKNNNVSIARKHAVEAVKKSPMRKESWRLLYCALRGH